MLNNSYGLTQHQIDEWIAKETVLDYIQLRVKPTNRYLLVIFDFETEEMEPHFFKSLMVMRMGIKVLKHWDFVTVYDTHNNQHLDVDDLPEA